jgi:hypothetical protein
MESLLTWERCRGFRYGLFSTATWIVRRRAEIKCNGGARFLHILLSPVPKCEEPGAPSRHTPELDFRIRRSGHVLSHPSLETSEGRGTHFVGGQETPSTGFVATQNPGFGK